ncbi:hypothetical protein SLA2020_273310 [Shorea laevis]
MEFHVSLYATCSVEFEFKNYTILTSQCKGPEFLPVACCNSFKDFACPYADAITDMTSDCAITMFDDIKGPEFPPGLFASMCSEGMHGLDYTNVDQATMISN